MEKEKKTQAYKIRLTKEEFVQFKEKAKSYSSVASMIRVAVSNLDDEGKKNKIDLLDDFSSLLSQYDLQLSHVSGNLNQVVKRANSLSLSNSLSVSFLEKELYPEIMKVNQTILEIKRMQKSIFSKLLKL